jgi:flavin reductase (DIM6/NTAB) family NADH-FMN oxidoreductase RutF
VPVSGDRFRDAMRRWASGVTVVTVRHDEHVRAILVTSFLSVSLDPPTVLVSIRRDGETHRLLEASRLFAVNLLRAEQAALATALGYANDPAARSLATAAYHSAATGAPILDDCLAFLDCRIVEQFETKDHTLYVGLVEASDAGEGAPLVHWERAFHRLALPVPAPVSAAVPEARGGER